MPDNAGFMFAAYIAAALVFAGYVMSLIVRARAMVRRGDAINSVSRS